MTTERRRPNPWYWAGYGVSWFVGRVFFRLRIVHPERRVLSGPLIIAVNHQSFLDPPLIGSSSGREVFFLARKTLLDLPVLGWLLPKINVIPVDQEGTDRNALKALIRIVKNGEATAVFPEGARTLDGKLQPAQPGLGFVIAKTRAPVLPMRIFGADKALPRGRGRVRFSKITVVIGDVIQWSEADVAGRGKELYQELSDRVMARIAQLQIE